MSFNPHVTVACVVEKDGRFLLVREMIDGCEQLNQPAGHLEANETLQEAAKRETLEETGWGGAFPEETEGWSLIYVRK